MMDWKWLTAEEINGMIGKPIYVRWREDHGLTKPIIAREGYALILDRDSVIACDSKGSKTLKMSNLGITWNARRLVDGDVA